MCEISQSGVRTYPRLSGPSVAARWAPRKPDGKAMMVSPYLKRPVRSLDEVLSAMAGSERIEAVVAQTLAEAAAAGQEPPDQISQAVEVLRRLYPGLSARNARTLIRNMRARG